MWITIGLLVYACSLFPCAILGLCVQGVLHKWDCWVLSAFVWSLFFPFALYLFTLDLICISGILHRLIPYPEEGVYPLGHRGHVKRWAVHAGIFNFVRVLGLLRLIHANPLLRRLFYRFSGAKIHPSVVFSLDSYVFDPFLVEIGEGSKLGEFVHLSGHYSDKKHFVIQKTRIGKNVIIGGGSRIIPGVTVADDTFIRARSLVLPDWARDTNCPL
jgi:acetyltransferase-like isoleucine patch superfamily enzyme